MQPCAGVTTSGRARVVNDVRNAVQIPTSPHVTRQRRNPRLETLEDALGRNSARLLTAQTTRYRVGIIAPWR